MSPSIRLRILLLSTAIVLIIPFIAMQLTTAVRWTLLDFLTAAVLLCTTALLCEFILRKVKKTEYRIALIAAILLGLLLVWIELAVGLFESPIAGS